jgi:hypothetical protein
MRSHQAVEACQTYVRGMERRNDNTKTLILSRSRQCGIDIAKASLTEVHAVATMDRMEKYSQLDISESTLYSAFTFCLHGLPYDYDALRLVKPPKACQMCNTALTYPRRLKFLHKRMFSWQTSMGKCGGDKRCAQAHEVVKLHIKRMAMCNPDPGGTTIPPKQLILEARHLRSDALPLETSIRLHGDFILIMLQ